MSDSKHIGVVTQVIGPVIDVRFDDGKMPDILNAIEVNFAGRRLVAEVSAHVGDDVVRCVAMS
ncbi:MAG: F0F1 ATP synthase subunit beta, partial [Clostridia bacterium]|nr:F0F1 ATP synthase subunit beta [Clostridia bacterium]